MILIQLFTSFLKISLFSIGGGFSFLPVMENEIVQSRGWMDKSEFLNFLGLSQMIPGALSIKYATYTGYKVAGILGAITANVANLLPPVILILIAAFIYTRYKEILFIKAAFTMMRYAIFAMILATVIHLVDKSHIFEAKYLIVISIAFVLCLVRVNAVLILICAGVVGAFIEYMF